MKTAALVLIAKYFGLSLREAKTEAESLTDLDRRQLGTSIAQQQGLTQDACNFQFVTY